MASTVSRAMLQPGWRWSESIKPVVGTESCRVNHFGVLTAVACTLCTVTARGRPGLGHVYRIEAGHDAWVVGDEPAVGLKFDSQAAATFAKS